jgi:hypothetical protein
MPVSGLIPSGKYIGPYVKLFISGMVVGVMVAVGGGEAARVALLVGYVSSFSAVVGDGSIAWFDGMLSIDALDASPMDIPAHPPRKMDTSTRR